MKTCVLLVLANGTWAHFDDRWLRQTVSSPIQKPYLMVQHIFHCSTRLQSTKPNPEVNPPRICPRCRPASTQTQRGAMPASTSISPREKSYDLTDDATDRCEMAHGRAREGDGPTMIRSTRSTPTPLVPKYKLKSGSYLARYSYYSPMLRILRPGQCPRVHR